MGSKICKKTFTILTHQDNANFEIISNPDTVAKTEKETIRERKK